ncbi:TPA: hypothetical protein JLJ42_000200 [Escherichia coli]|nr:phage tail fiber protein [Escherichia coli]EJZ9501407.1 hypothetical protein [Escherichia coli]MCO4883760.1 phage tail fiber protein [Escherichia coli]HAW0523913.1 hypothetical protein [Escherichia coli]
MTVSTEVNYNEYIGNGVTNTFPYSFRIFKENDLQVSIVKDDITEPLILNTDYTVTGVGSYTGGNVVTTFPVMAGSIITIERSLPIVQETDLRNQGSFFAEVHEDAFDYLTMLLQECFGWRRLALLKPGTLASYYDAKNNRISNLADPVNPQDAATKEWASTYFEQFTGQSSNTNNILYDDGSLYDYLKDRSFRVVDSISQLKNVKSYRNQRVFVLGYYSKGDGGGGPYFLDSADTTSSDNGGTVIVAADGGRWKLSHNGVVSILQFGAKGNAVANDSPAFNSAVADYSISKIIVPNKSSGYKLQATVNIQRNNLHIEGVNYTKIIQAAGVNCFKLSGSFLKVSGFNFDGSAQVSNCPVILLGTDITGMTNVEICDMYGERCFGFISDGVNGTNRAIFVNFENITLAKQRGIGIDTYDCWASFFMNRCTVDRVGQDGVDYNYPHFRVRKAEGAFILNCAANGSASTSIQSSQDGLSLDSSNFVVIDNFIPDHTGGTSLKANNCANIKITNSSFPNATQGGLAMTGCSFVDVANLFATGYSSAPAGANGMSFINCTDINISNCRSATFKQNSFISLGSSRMVVSGCKFYASLAYGVVTANNGATIQQSTIFRDCLLYSNSTGNFSIAGATTVYFRDIMKSDGTLVSGAAPATGAITG